VVQQGNDDATLVSPSTRIAPADSPAESEANSAAAQFSGHRSIAPEIKRYATAIRLQKAPGKCSTTVTINCTDEDLLTAVCIGEAGNIIDTDGKKGVMNVVMNRVAEGGGSLRSVATAPGQFQGLNNGIKHLNDSSFAACRPLAQEVMASPAQDPTAGAVFFDQSCSKPCTEYCTVYLGDGKTNAHYFARRARPTEEKDCKNRKLNPTARNRHCCLAPKQRMYVLPELTITPGDEEAKKVETKDSTKSRGAPTPLVPNQL
jgi:hypothetical protein